MGPSGEAGAGGGGQGRDGQASGIRRYEARIMHSSPRKHRHESMTPRYPATFSFLIHFVGNMATTMMFLLLLCSSAICINYSLNKEGGDK